MNTVYFVVEKISTYLYGDDEEHDVYYNIIKPFNKKGDAIKWIAKYIGVTEGYYKYHEDEIRYKVKDIDEVTALAKMGNIANI